GVRPVRHLRRSRVGRRRRPGANDADAGVRSAAGDPAGGAGDGGSRLRVSHAVGAGAGVAAGVGRAAGRNPGSESVRRSFGADPWSDLRAVAVQAHAVAHVALPLWGGVAIIDAPADPAAEKGMKPLAASRAAWNGFRCRT